EAPAPCVHPPPMDPRQQQLGAFCHYPPRLALEVDITERVEAEATRYIVRNAATARYFILKPTEFSILSQFDGTLAVSDIAKSGSPGTGLRLPMPTLVRFLGKLDSLGLLARGGTDDITAAHQPARGLYIRFPLFNPDKFLAFLDKTLGWALTKSSIVTSFVLMALVGFCMI